MNKLIFLLFLVVIIFGFWYYWVPVKETNMQISSEAFSEGGFIPPKYTCDGENINPELSLADIPKETKSLALIMDDPDVPKNLRPDGLFVHWVMWNINPNTIRIEENSTPEEAAEGLNGAGRAGYTGPCPPDREHRYFFKIYALDTRLELPSNTDKNALERAIGGHIISSAELMGRYDRKR